MVMNNLNLNHLILYTIQFKLRALSTRPALFRGFYPSGIYSPKNFSHAGNRYTI